LLAFKQPVELVHSRKSIRVKSEIEVRHKYLVGLVIMGLLEVVCPPVERELLMADLRVLWLLR